MTGKCLPEGFDELSRFVESWSLATAFERDGRRGKASIKERQDFYDAFNLRLLEALDLLDKTNLQDHGKAEKNLMWMALSFAHVAQAIEVHGPDEKKHARSRERIPIASAPGDY